MNLSLLAPAVLATLLSHPAVAKGQFGKLEASKEWTMPDDAKVLANLRKWQDRKLGILIHWCTYSEWGIVESWSLVTTRHEWNNRPPQYASLDDRAYEKLYEGLATKFNPTKFDPDKWAKAFKDAGVKYVFSMTKHHDGFAMWDTKETDYRITSPTVPFHSDPRADTVKLTSEAFRRQGLSSGLYFSKADWHCPHYWLPELGPGSGQGPNYDPKLRPAEWQKFKEYTWRQVDELMSNYGKQDVLWLDGGAVRPPNADIDMNGMVAMARKKQPGLIVVDRTVGGINENYVTPEGEIPDHYLPYPWETCMTMGTSWPWTPHDHFKSVRILVRNLCHIVARGGNYLIGIGPDSNGEFDPTVYDRLSGLGAWLKRNGQAIYATRPIAPYEQKDCVFTQRKDGSTYAIILAPDDQSTLPESLRLPPTFTAKSVQLFGYGKLPVENNTIQFPEEMRKKSHGEAGWAMKLIQ